MVNKEALEGMTAEQVMQLLQEVKERRRTAIALANDAIDGYQKAVNARDAKIKELRDDLGKQLADIADKAAALNAAMLQASMTGDGAEVGKAQCTLAELEGQRSQLNARMELLKGKPPRCDEAYTAMEKAVAESEKAAEQYSEDIQPIREFCENTIKIWSKIVEEIRDWSKVDRFSLDRAREHYSKENSNRKEI